MWRNGITCVEYLENDMIIAEYVWYVVVKMFRLGYKKG